MITSANNVIIAFDLVSIIRDKKLRTTISCEGLQSEHLLCNTTLRTESRTAEEYIDIFDLSILETISIIDGMLSVKKIIFRDLVGLINIDNSKFTSGKIHVKHKTADYLVDILPVEREKTSEEDVSLPLQMSVRSDNLGFQSLIVLDGSDLIFESLDGMFYTCHFGFTGNVHNYLLSDMSFALKGFVETNLITLKEFDGPIGKLSRNRLLSGDMKASVGLEGTDFDIAQITASSAFSLNNIKIDSLKINTLSGNLTLEKGRLTIPSITGDIYGGALSGDVKMDLAEKGLPFMLSLFINDMDYGSLLADLTEDTGAPIYGHTNMNLSVQGYASDSSTYKGHGALTVSNGNLGPMPILTPLLGNIYTSLQDMFPKGRVGNITEAYVDFEIDDQKISTDDLTFMGEDVSITAQGYMDFDGNLNFFFQNELRDPSDEEDEDWQVSLRNTIINLGKLISKVRLTGTIKDPVWGL